MTGNVQVDARHLENPGNVVIQGTQDATQRAALQAWSAAAKSGGGHVWMQLAHAGRQTDRFVNAAPKAPSAVALALPGVRFGQPSPLTEVEILDLIDRFGHAATVARETGFDGVELHAAHGYLFSQFLSPLSNQRRDDWGGDLRHRARFLLETVRAIRARVGPDFPIAVKLNSADFQRGGFSVGDSQTVAGWLDDATVDVIEISGGNYEQMADNGGLRAVTDDGPSRAAHDREAYFASFAPEMRRQLTRTPLMVTGGFRTAAGMVRAIADGAVDLIGIARPLCLDPEAPAALLAGHPVDLTQPSLRVGPGLLGPTSPIKRVRLLNGIASASWYNEHVIRLAAGQRPDRRLSLVTATLRAQARIRRMASALEAHNPPGVREHT